MRTCVLSTSVFGAELWWKGDQSGMAEPAKDLQLLINQQARATTGAFRTTNLGALSMESGLRPATNQLENGQRRFGLRLLSLPRGDNARVLVGACTAIGQRLSTALAYTGRTQETVLLEDPGTLDAELIQEEEEEARKEAGKPRPGITMITEGSRLEDGAAGYAVTWRRVESWVGIQTHMGYNQEAYDEQCAALVHALETAARRTITLEQTTIFTDAQAAIKRMASEEPGPGRK